MTRYYTREAMGSACPVCKLRVPLALTNAGITTHPMCEWTEARRG